MTTSNEHNNAPAVPQGWRDAASAALTLLNKTQRALGNNLAKHPADHFATVGELMGMHDCRDGFLVRSGLSGILNDTAPSTNEPWPKSEPVRLSASRIGRVYVAGPMTGLPESNFPAFNQEAERLRAEGLQVLNPADLGIVDGADWADYLRHDIAGLASCERIHLLRGWTKSKGACLEMTIAKALGMAVTYQVDAEMEHNNAPAVPSGLLQKLDASIAWLERGEVLPGTPACIGLDDIKVIRALLAATPAPAPAPAQEFNKSVADAEIKALYVESQGSDKGWLGIEGSYFIGGVVAARRQKKATKPAQDEPFGHFRAEPFGWTDCAATDDGAIALYEHPMTNPWRDAVIEQLESWHIYVPAIHDNSPRLAIKALVNMECKAALDPAVSSEAAALAAQGVQAPAPAQLTDEERADMACAVAAICTGASSRTVAATAIEWTERALRAKGGK